MANAFDSVSETPEMETLASLADNLVYRLPGCSDTMVRKALQDVYREFCRRSCCLYGRRHFTISSENPDVFVAPTFGGLVDTITDVRWNGRRLGQRDYMIVGNRVTFRDGLIPYPECREEDLPRVDLIVVEMPKLNSEEVPSWFVQQYGEAVCSGVLARLMAMSNRPWSDATQAQLDRIAYENAVNEARARYYGQDRDGSVGTALGNDELL